MKASDYARCALNLCVAAMLFSGCGGSQPPIGVPPVAVEQSTPHRAASGYRVLYVFHPKNGVGPGNFINVNGLLYGTTFSGGRHLGNQNGTIYTFTTTGKERVLYSFLGIGYGDGAGPNAVIDVNGTLYGTTSAGGQGCGTFYGCGTIFSLTTTGTEKVLYAFAGGSDGVNPYGLVNVNGTLYGTTGWGGTGSCHLGCGTLFSVTPSGSEKMLYSFSGGLDGAYPGGVINVHGTLYGMTLFGGGGGCHPHKQGCGNVFSATTSGNVKELYAFRGHSDGAFGGSLTYADGILYGTTNGGGGSHKCSSGCGTVFSLTTSGTETVLYRFRGGDDGESPNGVIYVKGTLYGTTELGGANGYGTIFSIPAPHKEKVLHSFRGGSDGSYPLASLIDVKGTLYGTTASGGPDGCSGSGCGTIFALTP